MSNELLLATQSQAVVATPANDYVAHYDLTGTGEDATTNYDGVETSMVYTNDATFGSVGTFDKVASKIATGYYTTTATTFSYAGWMNSTNVDVAVNTFVGDSDSGGTLFTLILGTYDSNFYVRVVNGSTDWYDLSSVSAVSVLDGLWHKIDITVDGTTMVLYIDGVLTYTYTMTTTMGQAGADALTIGAFGSAYTTSDFYSGYLSRIELYNYARTQAQITLSYDYELANLPIAVSSGLIAYYPLKRNSMDNYFSQLDGVTNGVLTYTGSNVSGFSTTDYISLSTNNITGLTAYSRSFWLLTTATTIQYYTYYSNGEHVIVLSGLIDGTTSNGNITFGIDEGLTDPLKIVFPYSNDGLWHNYVITWSAINGTPVVYEDATVVTLGVTDTKTTAIDTVITTISYVGHNYSSSGFESGINREYNTELTQTEVTSIYNAEKANFGL